MLRKFVHYRTGSLENENENENSQASVHYRTGSLEMGVKLRW